MHQREFLARATLSLLLLYGYLRTGTLISALVDFLEVYAAHGTRFVLVPFAKQLRRVALWHCRAQGDIHPAIVTLGRKYSSGEVTGATARAVEMLMAFKQVVADYHTPPDKVSKQQSLARSQIAWFILLVFVSEIPFSS